MTKIYLLTSVVIVSAIIVICAISGCDGIISDKRLCYDPECSEPVSLARTLIRYNSIEPHILSFPTNAEVIIFSKEAGRRLDLWGAQVLGKRGYVPKSMVREYKTLKSKLTYEVPTEFFAKEVNTTDKLKTDLPSQENIPQDNENVDLKVNTTGNESENPNDVKNEEVASESKTSDDSGKVEPEASSVDSPPADDSADPNAKDPVLENAEKILEGIQSATPSYEVIDGTTIPLLDEEVPIKPSYSTPIIAATVTSDEEPILSVHPKLPSNIRPLISRFSNSESQTIVEDHLKSESNSLAENQTGETDSNKQSLPVQEEADDSKIDKSDIKDENNLGNDSKIESNGNESLNSDTKPSEIEEPAEKSTENAQSIISSEENDKINEFESSDNSVNVSVDANSNEEGFTASETEKEAFDAVDNIVDNLEKENVTSNMDETEEDISETDLESNKIPPKFDETTFEILQNKSELEGTILEQELQDSKEQTEYLSDDKIIDTNKVPDGPDSVEEIAVIKETEIPLTGQIVQEHDNQVVVTDDVADHNENFTVHNLDDVKVETIVEDGSQNNSHDESIENGYPLDELIPGSPEVTTEFYPNFEEDRLTTARSLLAVDEALLDDINQSSTGTPDINEPDSSETQSLQEYENYTYNEAEVSTATSELETAQETPENIPFIPDSNFQETSPEICDINSDCAHLDNDRTFPNEEGDGEEEDDASYSSAFERHNYLETLLYLSITAFTTLLFSLGYYYIENQRRDKELVAKINVLEKELLVITKESMMLDEGLKATKYKLNSIEDESFGSNEMVISLKSELEAAQITKGELEDQILTLEKELESATEAGLELERMLREFLASQSDENPLAQSVEDLQTRLNAQQATNEALTSNLNLKSQENEALTTELAITQERCQQLEVEVSRLSGELKMQSNVKNNVEKEFSEKITQLNKRVNKLSEDRAGLLTQLTAKEMALNDLSEVIKQQSTENFDFEKLYNVSHIKAEAELIIKERDELKLKLIEVEGAHQLLEEHMKLIKEEIASVTEQYELAERDKIEAQTRLEVLSNYFKEKESQLQKELGMQEAMWVQKQGEVTSTVDRIQTMQNEIQNYRQQIETLKREILDQEREYKSQIAALETKSHEQWVIARQSERRLEESKAEASQLRNRLTMVEKSINEADSDSKLHRLETNGETASSPQLFMGAETSSSPIIFTGSSGVPPLPPSYMYGGPLPPPFIPPPPHSGGGPMYDISRRPPPLGGRLSSPPPIPPLHHPPGRYEDASSPPPPLSPPLHPSYNHRSPPPFSNERIHSHPPPPPFLPPLGTSHSWGDEPLPPLRNPVFHPHQREPRVRHHKGSLHSSGDSLDKTNHTGKS